MSKPRVGGCHKVYSTPSILALVLLLGSVQATATVVGDFNGDGKADILWRDSSTGQTAVWTMSGATVLGMQFSATVSDLNWVIVGVGDFNGDGKADIFWRNSSTGQTAVWLMNGATVVSMQLSATVSDPNWQVVGVGDFNGDGKADILWRNSSTGQTAVWMMNGAAIANAQYSTTVSDLTWQVVGVADFNGDGKVDILWRNSSTGQTAVWMMNGAAIANAQYSATVSDLHWQVVGVGDFNADGKADILWQNSTTGQTAVWMMNGAAIVNAQYSTTVSDLNWQVVGVSDFNGDGMADILWRNSSTGQIAVWLMNGASMLPGSSGIATISDLNWHVSPSAGGHAGAQGGQAQGVYAGGTSGGYSFGTIILPNDKFYAVYGTPSGNAFAGGCGLITGQGLSSSGTYNANVTVFDFCGFFPFSAPGTISASYIAGSSIIGTFSDASGTQSFTGTTLAASALNYNTPASLASITGTWTGSELDGTVATVTIQSNGTYVASDLGCAFSGTIKPDSSGKNFFDVTLTFGGAPCVFAGQTGSGTAVDFLLSDGVTRVFVAAAVLSDNSGGTVFTAQR